MGLLGNPQDPKLQQKVLKMIEFGDVAEVWKSQALDEAQIKKAIELLEDGEFPPYHELDNHIMYLQELNDYRKGDKFLKLPPQIQQMFLFFMETHIQGQVRNANPNLPEQQMMAEHMVEESEKQMIAAGQDPSAEIPTEQEVGLEPAMPPPMPGEEPPV